MFQHGAGGNAASTLETWGYTEDMAPPIRMADMGHDVYFSNNRSGAED